jgi:hypothetical protein
MKPAILTLLLLGLALLPTSALASLQPSTLTLRWGFDEGASTGQPEYSNVPALSATWPLGKKVSLWSGASYFQQSTRASNLRFIGASEHTYSRYFPLSVGLRIHALNAEGQQRGPFVEFGPSVTPAWYLNRAGDSGSALMGGLQAGTGFRIASLDGSRAELGLSYYLAEAFGENANANGRIGTPHQLDVSVFAVYVAFGIGD